jgi:uncharacterized phage protein (TIGR01671 family)
MTREIKFRSWDGEKMDYVLETPLWREDPGINGAINLAKDHDIILMQFTGIKDRNGKEIYEGDVCNEFIMTRSFPDGKNYKRIIKWEDDMTLDDSFGMTAVGFCLGGGTLEVIGNIYQDSHLLDIGV